MEVNEAPSTAQERIVNNLYTAYQSQCGSPSFEVSFANRGGQSNLNPYIKSTTQYSNSNTIKRKTISALDNFTQYFDMTCELLNYNKTHNTTDLYVIDYSKIDPHTGKPAQMDITLW